VRVFTGVDPLHGNVSTNTLRECIDPRYADNVAAIQKTLPQARVALSSNVHSP